MPINKFMISFLTLVLVSAHAAVACDWPNHLEPITPYDVYGTGYEQCVYETLVWDCSPEAWMIARPSFRSEYAIVLRKTPTGDSSEPHYTLEYAIAQQPIWNDRKAEGGQLEVDLRRNVTVDRQIVNQDPATTEKLLSTWRAVIEQTAYGDNECMGLDGETYDFYVHFDLFGGTWSPKTEVPRLMVESGQLLIEYVTATKVEEREKITDRLRRLLDKLSDEVE